MAAIKFSLFFLALFALSGAHYARHLHDGSFDRRPPVEMVEVIQMVIGGDRKIPTTPWKPQSWREIIYGRVQPKAPPSPKIGPPRGETTYGGDNPQAPPSWQVEPFRGEISEVKPSRGETNYGRDKPKSPPSPKVAPSGGQATYGRDNTKAPPSPEEEPPRGQGTYSRENPKAPPSPKVAPSGGETTYGQNKPKAPPSPKVAPSRGQTTYGRVKPKAPPPPKPGPSHGQTTYSSPKTTPSDGELEGVKILVSPKPDGSMVQTTNGLEEDRTMPLRLDPNGSQGQVMYGGIDPSEPRKPADPTLSEHHCIYSGRARTELSTSAIDEW